MNLDSLTYAGIVLLVLSQISEKITTFIRTYLKAGSVFIGKPKRRSAGRKLREKIGNGIRQLLNWLLILDRGSDLNRSKIQGETTTEGKDRVEFAITKLSVLIGVLLALAFHADLFAIFNNGGKSPENLFTWDGFTWKIFTPEGFKWKDADGLLSILKSVFGCFCAGFLLAFGSKFFHDLLEILYETKLARRNLTDPAIYQNTSLQQLTERLISPAIDPVWSTLERHRDILLRRYKSIISIERTFDSVGNSILDIRLDGTENEQEISEKYRFDFADRDGDKVLPRTRIRVIPNAALVIAQAKNKIQIDFPVGIE